MTQRKCESVITFNATNQNGKWYTTGTFPKRAFECRNDRGHEGKHRDYGSITIGNVSTEYTVEWGNPQINNPNKSSEESK